MAGIDEAELIKGCIKNKPYFQEQLHKQYYNLFMKVCARYAKNMHDAEQLLNDGFLRIFTNIKTFKGEGSFEGWMRRIMVNTCLDYLKSSALKTAMKMEFNDNMAEKFATHTDNTGLGNIQFKELVNLIQSLPPMTRTVWNLFVFDGYSHNQIAEELDITTGTSSWHIHQARSILQKKVKQLNSENPLYEDRRI